MVYTVVGSELFNMLIIVGGVCLVTPIPLTLDWRPLVREVTMASTRYSRNLRCVRN